MRRYFRPNLKLCGVTEQQWRVIRALDEHGGMEAGKLAEVTSILGPSLSGVLDRMERDGLVQRFRISTDQRKVIVEMAEKSREIVVSMQELVDRQYRDLEEQVGQETLMSLYNALDVLVALSDPATEEEQPVRVQILPKRKRRAEV